MTTLWGPQHADWIVRCPYCGSENCALQWSFRSLGRLIVQFFIALFRNFLPVGESYEARMLEHKLNRTCRDCRAPFDPNAGPPDLLECPRCGYPLAGTTADACPECGWALPASVRAARQRDRMEREGRF